MKYYLIVGEASGDLHAAHLMTALKRHDPKAEFRFIGGDNMRAAGGTMLRHYKEIAYMGFILCLRICARFSAAWHSARRIFSHGSLMLSFP